MLKYLRNQELFRILIFIILYFGENSLSQNDSSGELPFKKDPGLHYLEISVGIGYLWLLQINGTALIYGHFLFQAKYSTLIFAHDYGVLIGYQFRNPFFSNTFNRVLLGYSSGYADPFFFSDAIKWYALDVYAGTITYFSSNKRNFGLCTNIYGFFGNNLRTIGFNVGLLYGFL